MEDNQIHIDMFNENDSQFNELRIEKLQINEKIELWIGHEKD